MRLGYYRKLRTKESRPIPSEDRRDIQRSERVGEKCVFKLYSQGTDSGKSLDLRSVFGNLLNVPRGVGPTCSVV